MIIRLLRQADIQACPHCILMPSHYDASGACRCTDPAHDEMHEWGYVWNDNGKRWDAPPDEVPEYEDHN